MSLGARLRTARERAGKSSTQVAAAVGVTARTVENWEADRGEPKLSQVLPLCDVLDVTTAKLLGARERSVA